MLSQAKYVLTPALYSTHSQAININIVVSITQEALHEVSVFIYLLYALMASVVTDCSSDSSDKLRSRTIPQQASASTWLSCDNLADCYQAAVSPRHKKNFLPKSTTHLHFPYYPAVASAYVPH